MAALAIVGCALALAACGSSGHKSNRADAGIRVANCMRSHGVPNFPDPSHGGGGIQLGPGINPQSPAFQAAQKICFKLLPGGGPGRGQASESQKLAMLKLSRCMRAHGVTSFPDPTNKPPSPGNGAGLAFGAGGSFIAVPQSLMQSPGFKQAAATCHFPGFGGGGGRPKGAAG